ncbi:MAG TPA: beta-galactosidase [Candidatus Hydrogenedentes bacterium]|nr:beta-galactosidase [Candidatus Hydrogenedentota bacterium]
MMTIGLACAALLAGAGEIVLPGPAGVMAGKWTFSDGAEFPGAAGALEADAKGVLTLKYDFRGGGNYVGAYCTLDTPVALRTVTFRVRKPAEAQLTVRIADSAGQSFQKPVVYDHAGWQPVVCGMKDWTAHWGGANDGVVRPPIVSVGILLENVSLNTPVGEIHIADVGGEAGPMDSKTGAANAVQGEYVATDFGADSGFAPTNGSLLTDGLWQIDFSKVSEASLRHSLSLFGQPGALSLTVSGGRKGNVLKLTLGSHFQNFTRTLGLLDGSEQTFTVPPPPDGWVHSGAEEKNISYPLRVVDLTIERGDGPAQATDIRLIRLRCDTTVQPSGLIVLLASARETGVSGAERNAQWGCTMWNMTANDVAGTLTLTLRDWDERVLHTESRPCTLPARGQRHAVAIDRAVPASLHFADAEFRFDAPEFAPATSRAGLTQPMADAGDAALRPELPWGMGVYLYRYGDYGQMEKIAAAAQAAGVKWTREEFSWAGIERARGVFDFTFYDQVVNTALKHGISVYGLLSYWSTWTKAYTEEGIDDFCVWARATVSHFKDRVKHWEIYNEPNIFFWSGPKELYPVLVKKCYAAIKEADPEAIVLAISTAGVDRKFIQQCLDAQAPFDILTIHPYRARLNDAQFVKEMRSTAELVNGRPVWITEMGWSTHIGGVDERAQAQLLARCYLAAVASGAIQNIGWYDFRNDGDDPFYFEANFGTLRTDLTPKPAYRALATVCRTFDKGKPGMPKRLPKGVLALEMGDALAVWTQDKPATVTCRVGRGGLNVSNLMGEPVQVERDGSTLTVPLRPGSPVFMKGAKVKVLVPREKKTAMSEPDPLRF